MFKSLLEKFKKDERGLTLVELLAVVVILAIVGAIAFVAIGNVIENSRQDAHIANAQQIISAAKLAEASGTDVSSIDLTSVELDTLDFDNLVDPWDTQKYETATVTNTNGVYTINLVPTNGENCPINHTELQLTQQSREEICGDEGSE